MKRLSCAAFVIAATAFNAQAIAADLLDIKGSYGSPAGCKYLKTKDYSDETIVLLSTGEFQTYASLCEFLQVLKPADGSSVITALCASEGDSEQSVEFLRVVKGADGADAYDVFGQAGDLQARVERCS